MSVRPSIRQSVYKTPKHHQTQHHTRQHHTTSHTTAPHNITHTHHHPHKHAFERLTITHNTTSPYNIPKPSPPLTHTTSPTQPFMLSCFHAFMLLERLLSFFSLFNCAKRSNTVRVTRSTVLTSPDVQSNHRIQVFWKKIIFSIFWGPKMSF